MRLRQAVLAAPTLQPLADRLKEAFALPEPFHDPGVAEFGLENAVFPVGHTFLEVVAPVREGTAAGRYLDRRGNPEAAGYMAIFQVDDLAAARRRLDEQKVRVVWQADLPDIAGTHLHPADMPGAIVSIDWAAPTESWHWAGPRWRGGAPADAEAGGVAGFTLAVPDPAAVEQRWRDVLGAPPAGLGVAFAEGADGIVEIRLTRPAAGPVELRVGTVRLSARAAAPR